MSNAMKVLTTCFVFLFLYMCFNAHFNIEPRGFGDSKGIALVIGTPNNFGFAGDNGIFASNSNARIYCYKLTYNPIELGDCFHL